VTFARPAILAWLRSIPSFLQGLQVNRRHPVFELCTAHVVEGRMAFCRNDLGQLLIKNGRDRGRHTFRGARRERLRRHSSATGNQCRLQVGNTTCTSWMFIRPVMQSRAGAWSPLRRGAAEPRPRPPANGNAARHRTRRKDSRLLWGRSEHPEWRSPAHQA
jgi:hypothetical protein